VPRRLGRAVSLDLQEADQLLDRLEREDSTVVERQCRLMVTPTLEDIAKDDAIRQDDVPVGAVPSLLGDASSAKPVTHILSVRLESTEPQLLVVAEHLEVLLETSPSRLGGVLVRHSHKNSLPLCQKMKPQSRSLMRHFYLGVLIPARQS